MTDVIGTLAAVASSSLGGVSIGVTRFVVGATDPITLGAFRFGIGSIVLLPCAWATRRRWPSASHMPAILLLGLLYFALFPILFNASLARTSAARGALALSTLPLLTMLVGAMLRVERLTKLKTAGVLLATAGVAVALLTDLVGAPPGAWRGDLLMVAAALCMALYSIWSRPLMREYGTMVYTAVAMTVGAIALSAVAAVTGGFAATVTFGSAQWSAIGFLGLFGGAITFLLWSYALEKTTPTRVAISVTVNPIVTSVFAAYVLSEPVTMNLLVGFFFIATGIVVASGERKAVLEG